MPLLDAALAYALTLLLFATIVSAAVGAIYRALGLKEKGLATFLKSYSKKELSTIFHSELHQVSTEVDNAVSKKLVNTTDNVVKIFEDATHSFINKDTPSPTLLNKGQAKQLVNYGTDEFITHLRNSEFGKNITAELKEQSNELFDRLATRYEKIGTKFGDVLRKKTRILATLLGIFFAYGINIDSVHILSTYMSNGQLRGQIVGTQNAILSNYNNQKQPATSQNLSGEITMLSNSVHSLHVDAFPVGWSNFPHCPSHATDYRCTVVAKHTIKNNLTASTNTQGIEAEVKTNTRSLLEKIGSHFELYITWFLGCLITGLLSGLGAPFWYYAVKNITQMGKKKV